MRIVDYGLHFLADYCTAKRILDASGTAFRECKALLEKTLMTAGLKRGQEIGYKEAYTLLHNSRSTLETFLQKESQGYPALRWLWYLRRLPAQVFCEAKLATTGPYDARLAEVVSGLGGDPNPEEASETQLGFRLNDAIARRLLKFAHGIRVLSTIHSGIRQASKGVSFLFDGTGLLDPRPTRDQLQGIDLFDRRVANFGSILGRVGTLISDNPEGIDVSKCVLLFGRLERCDWTNVHGTDDEIHARFGWNFVPLTDLEVISTALRESGIEGWSMDSMLLLVFLRMVMRASPSLPSALSTIAQNGYFLVAKDVLQKVPQSWLDADMEFATKSLGVVSLQATPLELLNYVEQMKPGLWPLTAGRCLQSIGKYYCVDVVSATTHLSLSLEFPALTGKVANIRGGHFELAIQKMIDASPLKPPPHIRKLRGRDLKLDGATITDLDALAVKGETLVIVSCKSAVLDSKYDSGDLNSVANACSRLQDYLSDAVRHQKVLTDNKRGNNYDFGEFRFIVVVICSPYAIFAPPGLGTEYVLPGLPRYLPSLEFKEWLHS